MSIQTELTRITNAKSAIKTAIEGKGVTVPDGTLLDGMASRIEAIEASGGVGSVPKPLTYDYMPDGYPSKAVQTTTLMEEQELAFTLSNGLYTAQLTNAFEVIGGQTYTVNWDGTEYECVNIVFNSIPVLGNLSIMGVGADTGEPFIYVYNAKRHAWIFATIDTAASHTISVKKTEEIVTPMADEFLPDNTKNTTVFYL